MYVLKEAKDNLAEKIATNKMMEVSGECVITYNP